MKEYCHGISYQTKKSYSLVYYYTDENGETKQKWETIRNYQDALKRKAEVENEINKGTFIPPSDQTVREFLYDFVTMYGEQKWSVSMYDGCTGLIGNYINPLIGDLKIQSITTRTTDKFVQTLQKTPYVQVRLANIHFICTPLLDSQKNDSFSKTPPENAKKCRNLSISALYHVPGRNRTAGIQLRRQALYPTEVRGLIHFLRIYYWNMRFSDLNGLTLRRRPLYPTAAQELIIYIISYSSPDCKTSVQIDDSFMEFV